MLLSYPDFNQPFEIHTNASHTQLGAVISQKNKPIAFYSRKLQLAQRWYTTTVHELLSIIETLKEFKNILLGQQIVVYTNHKNLTYKNFNMEHIMRWQLLVKEFGPTIGYIKGPKTIIANVLSRLDLVSAMSKTWQIIMGSTKRMIYQAMLFRSPTNLLINHKIKLFLLPLSKVQSTKCLKIFMVASGPHAWFLCYKDRIVIPEGLQKWVIQWYHHTLCHPGINQTEETISQHFYWKNMRDHITHNMYTCSLCQKQKKQHKKYRLLPEKEAEYIPWERLCQSHWSLQNQIKVVTRYQN